MSMSMSNLEFVSIISFFFFQYPRQHHQFFFFQYPRQHHQFFFQYPRQRWNFDPDDGRLFKPLRGQSHHDPDRTGGKRYCLKYLYRPSTVFSGKPHIFSLKMDKVRQFIAEKTIRPRSKQEKAKASFVKNFLNSMG